MRVLLTGATGLIGKALCRVLAAEGHELVVLSRKGSGHSLPGNAKAFAWQPEQEIPPVAAWEGVEAVVHLAGEPIAAGRWTPTQKGRIRNSRVIGTRNLVDGMKGLAHKPKVLVCGSAVGYYGNRGDEKLDEHSTPGTGFMSDVCLAWEKEGERAATFGVRVTCARIGVVLSQEGGALEKMLLPFKLGLGARLGDGQQWFPWIYLDDIVGVLRHALLQPIQGPINGVAPGIVNNEQFTREFASVLHRPTFLPVPEFALRMLLGEMADVLLNSQYVTPRIALETGYQFRFPQLRSALEAILK